MIHSERRRGGVIKKKLSPTEQLLEAQAHAINELRSDLADLSECVANLVDLLSLLSKAVDARHKIRELVTARANAN